MVLGDRYRGRQKSMASATGLLPQSTLLFEGFQSENDLGE